MPWLLIIFARIALPCCHLTLLIFPDADTAFAMLISPIDYAIICRYYAPFSPMPAYAAASS